MCYTLYWLINRRVTEGLNIVCVAHFYASVADAAVGAARGPVELAGDAPLHAHRDAVDVDVFVEGRAEVVPFVVLGGSCDNK